MKPLYLSGQIKQIEALNEDEIGMPSLLLMEHAGMSVVEHILNLYPGEPVTVFCGPGNNGGDGFVIARILFLMGLDVLTLVLPHESSIKDDAAVNYKILKNLQSNIKHLEPSRPLEIEWTKDRILVDCIFGTGFSRPLTGTYKIVVEEMNASVRPIISIDIPSGVNGDTGLTMGASISADLTIALGTYKLGHFQNEGFSRKGKLFIADIGLPALAQDVFKPKALLFEGADVKMMLKAKDIAGHKYSSGKVLFFSGSKDMPGAALFNAMGALRIGVGLVKMIVERSVWNSITGRVPETIALTYSEDAIFGNELTEKIVSEMEKYDVLAAGSGCGESPLLRKFICKSLEMENKIIVLDADALNLLSKEIGLLDQRGLGTKVVITPHTGEFKRLLGDEYIGGNFVELARNFSKKHEVYTVLKGPTTIVAEPGGEVFICANGHRAMATAGSGDVLAGVVAGVLAQVDKTAEGILEAVAIHQKAGCLAAERIHERSVLATDIADSLSAALSNMTE
ncbi:MAG: NAD(P)H-hydrate dehydratase [Peptostreptococcaceae bacterium]|nr:NAD(P)H-hydrate dehydratase [Peptostreptococcaceae bacterium]